MSGGHIQPCFLRDQAVNILNRSSICFRRYEINDFYRWENGVILPDSGVGGGQEPLSRVPGVDHRPLHTEDYHADVEELLYFDMQSVEPNLNKRKPAPESIIKQGQDKMLLTLQGIAAKLVGN